MTDQKITQLDNVSAVADADEFHIVPSGGQSKATTAALIRTITPIDRTSSRTLAVQATLAQDVFDVIDPDYGADKTGVGDSAAAMQGIIDGVTSGQPIMITVGAGTFKLDTDVTANGRIASAQIDPGAVFTGSGSLDLFGTPNDGNWGHKNSYIAAIRGSPSVPLTELSPLAAFLKYSDNSGDTTGTNPAVTIGHVKRTTAALSHVEALYVEAVDEVGGDGFVEGARIVGLVKTGAAGGASAYGAIIQGAGDTGISMDFTIGVEGHCVNKDADAPALTSFVNTKISAAFSASNGQSTFISDAGYICNPFNEGAGAGFRTGFLVPAGSVIESAFACTDTVINGLNMTFGTFAQAVMTVPNNTVIIRARNAADSLNDNILSYTSNDEVHIGTSAAAVKLLVVDTSDLNPILRSVRYGATDSGGSGFRQLIISN